MVRRTVRRPIPKLSHEAVREHMMDYHFGRLSPELNAAVERHVRSCAICQREGLEHLATQKREAVRLTRRSLHAHSRKRRIVRLFELLLSVTMLLLLLPVLLLPAYRQRLPWLSGQLQKHLPAPTSVAQTPTPTRLNAALTFAPASAGSVAVAYAPDGKLAALASVQNGAPLVAIWDAASGKQVELLAYPDDVAPGVLAWAPDGKHVAAADGAHVMIWDRITGALLLRVILPQGPAIRVYDAQAGGVVQRLDPAVVFAQGPFAQWGADGQILSASASAAGPSGAALPGGPIVGVWQVTGSHIFTHGSAQAYVGISDADVSAHLALLTWSPDNRYLLWGNLARPIDAAPAAVATGTPHSTATVPASPTPVAGALQPPNDVARAVAAHVAASTQADALIWFAPSGAWVAYCDRTQHAAPLMVTPPDASRPPVVIPGACANLTTGSLAWRPDSSGFMLAAPAHPVAIYAIPTAPHG